MLSSNLIKILSTRDEGLSFLLFSRVNGRLVTHFFPLIPGTSCVFEVWTRGLPQPFLHQGKWPMLHKDFLTSAAFHCQITVHNHSRQSCGSRSLYSPGSRSQPIWFVFRWRLGQLHHLDLGNVFLGKPSNGGGWGGGGVGGGGVVQQHSALWDLVQVRLSWKDFCFSPVCMFLGKKKKKKRGHCFKMSPRICASLHLYFDLGSPPERRWRSHRGCWATAAWAVHGLRPALVLAVLSHGLSGLGPSSPVDLLQLIPELLNHHLVRLVCNLHQLFGIYF